MSLRGPGSGRSYETRAKKITLNCSVGARHPVESAIHRWQFSGALLFHGQAEGEDRTVSQLAYDPDGATMGFGLRNLADVDAGLAETHRVLKPGSRAVILEFTTPPRQPLRGLYFFYFRHILPRIGRLVSHHGDAYSYLPESVLAFPEPPALAERMRAQGFGQVEYSLLLGGICAVHVGVKSERSGP